ncbi:glycoside hydrolase family 3 protein [Rutstroemia sp. NJR-2017a WRK4]|nr:glycoside hydrolase family 3 protein [Rutstroemia sp. NJR-2017a WRK4]
MSVTHLKKLIWNAYILFISSVLAHEYGKARRAACLPAPKLYTANITFVGCYTDAEERALPNAQFNTVPSGNDPQNCANLCGNAGYAYAGVEYSTQCYCGSSITNNATQVAATACTATCAGNSTQICGGTWFIDIYTISNPSTDPSTSASIGHPDCTRDPLCSLSICDTSLSITDRVSGLISAMTLAEKTANMENAAPGVLRLGLPAYNWWNEALHGVAGSPGVAFTSGGNFSYATSFPMPILTSAAFDDALVNSIAKVVGREGRAFANVGKAGYDFWTPNINGFKDPRWGRGLETPGEDPYRISRYITSLIPGLEGGIDPAEKQVIATCKHYAVYDVETGRNSYDYDPTPQELSEYYMVPFKSCARDAKVGAVMCSYNAVNGIPSCANRYLLQTMLRDHWGWKKPYQWVTSDCAAITNIYNDHHYVNSSVNAAAVALNAGTDLACESGTIYNSLTDAVSAGTTTDAVINQSLSRLYTSLVNVGYFGDTSPYSSIGWQDVNTAEAQRLAYEAAVEGMVLLKNDGTLPLPKSPSNVIIIGPWANATSQMQGNYYGNAPFLISPLTAFKASWKNVTYHRGTSINSNDTSDFAATLTAAGNADYVIYCGGIDTSVEAEGRDRISVTWPGNQLTLINELAGLGKKLIVVQFGGGQLDDTALLGNSKVNSLVWAGYPGQAGGNALRDILDGTRTIAGRLPVTQYPANYTDEVSIFDPGLRPISDNPGRTYMWYTTPVLPFGHGLHYTNFTFAWSAVPSSTYEISTLLSGALSIIETTAFSTVTAKVTNIGSIGSDYVGLLFISTTDAGPSPYPIKALVSYDRLFDIKSNDSDTLTFSLTLGSLARVATNGSFVIYPGTYVLTLDNEPALSYSFTLTGPETLIESVPIPPTVAPPSILHLGCYSDGSTRTLNGSMTTNTNTNTPQECALTCHASGYQYAGLEYGRECWCGSNISSSGVISDASNCDHKCTGNFEESCGGYY